LAPRLTGRECNCFGAIAPATIGWRLAERNAGLAVLAGAGWYIAQRKHLGPISLSQVLVVMLFGVILLMLNQYRRLREAGRPTSQPVQEAE
jgi:hypothetical protein